MMVPLAQLRRENNEAAFGYTGAGAAAVGEHNEGKG